MVGGRRLQNIPVSKESRRPILITGSHRSGSTWVGRMVASSPAIGYIWEPFNPRHSRGIFNAPVERYYTWVSDHNDHRYEAALRETLAFKYGVVAGVKSLTGIKDCAKLPLDYCRSLLYRREGRRGLLKDPLALFSAEWIAAKFDVQVVVLIRHPAAFVNSLLKAQWRHRFSHFLEQPELMAERLAPFREEIERAARRTGDIVDEGTLLWRINHYAIRKYRETHPDWLFIRHEDLSIAPAAGFEEIFRHLGLDYTSRVKKTIEAYSRAGNPVERPDPPSPPAAKLDSQKNVDRWAYRLSAEQIERIRRGSADVWPTFYTDEDWEPVCRREPGPGPGSESFGFREDSSASSYSGSAAR